jgi:hypothetical protein
VPQRDKPPTKLENTIGVKSKIDFITLESSSEPLTTGIEHCLPWMKEFDQSKASNFIRGISR